MSDVFDLGRIISVDIYQYSLAFKLCAQASLIKMKNENQFLKKTQATGLHEIIQDKRKAAKTES